MSNDAPKPPPPPPPAPAGKKAAPKPPPPPAVKKAPPKPPPPAAPTETEDDPTEAQENPFTAVVSEKESADLDRGEPDTLTDEMQGEDEEGYDEDEYEDEEGYDEGEYEDEGEDEEPAAASGALDQLGDYGAPPANAGLGDLGGGLGGYDEPFSDSTPLPADDTGMRKMRIHTTTTGRIIVSLLVLGALGVGVWGYFSHQRYESRMDRLHEIDQIEDQGEMLAALREELQRTRYPDVKQRILMNLGHFKDTQAIPLMIEQLQVAGKVRRSAAWALANIGLPDAAEARDDLLAVLPETDERDRAQVVWTLAVLQEPDAADAIIEMFSQGRLQHLDGFSARVITDVLGPERLSSEELINHDEESVRVLTAHALAELGSEAAVEPLSAMITAELARPEDEQSEEVIRSASAGLGRSGHPSAARPLFAVLQSGAVSKTSILNSLAHSTAAPDLAILLGAASDAAVRRDLVRLVAEAHDPRVTETLVNLLDDEDQEIRETAALALADFGDRRAQDVLLEMARNTEDRGKAREAIAALRNVVDESSADAILELAREREDMKADIMRVLGATGNPAVAGFLKDELDGVDKRSAALAIADLDYDPLYRRLLDQVERPSHVDMGSTSAADRSLRNEDLLNERRAAIVAMGVFGRDDALDELHTVVEDGQDDYELRSMAAAAIGQIANDEQIARVLDKIQGDSISDISKRYYVQALWQQPHPELNDRLLDLIQSDAPADLRRAAALAIGYAADPSNDERLIQMLGSDHTRRQAAFAIALGGGEEAVSELIRVLSDDADLREVLRVAVTGEDSHWFDLLSEDMFRSGAVWRRLRAAYQLKEGEGDTTYSYFWQHLIQLFENGSPRPGGASARFVREQLWNAIAGSEREQLWTASAGAEDLLRRLAAEALFDMREQGILLRARDQGGPAEEAARSVIQRSQSTAAPGEG